MKKQWKRLLAGTLSVMLCLQGGMTSQFYNGLSYEVQAETTEDGFVIEEGVLIGYTGEGGAVVIPDGVSKIAQEAFRGNTAITSVVIPGNVELETYAFEGCTNLEKVSMGDGVTFKSYDSSWGSYKGQASYTFQNCSALKEVELPSDLTQIYGSMFGYCSSLENITFPENIEAIGPDAFSHCSSLGNVAIPESVTSVGPCAFESCTNLSTIEFPEGLDYIGDDAFYNTSWMDAMLQNNEFVIINGQLIDTGAFSENLVIPNGVTVIGPGAFEYDSMSTVVIPGSVEVIDDDAFQSCNNLTSVTMTDGLKKIGESAFYDCDDLTTITIPGSVTEIGRDAFYSCNNLESIEIPASVTEIGRGAFSATLWMETQLSADGLLVVNNILLDGKVDENADVVVPDGVVEIVDDPFDVMIKSIQIPKSVEKIGQLSYNWSNGLTIYGYKNSAAQEYAKESSSRKFVALDSIFYSNPDLLSRLTGYGMADKDNDGDVTIEELSALTGLPESMYTSSLSLSGIKDVSQLQHAKNITKFRVMGLDNDNVSVFSYFPKLEDVYIRESAELTNIKSLETLSNLKTLRIDGDATSEDGQDMKLSDISAVGKLTNLTSLTLNCPNVKDVSAVGKLTNLTSLTLDCGEASDISALGNLTKLETLVLNGSKVEDISVLSKLKNLKEVTIYCENVKNISSLKELANVEKLSLDCTGLTSLQELEGLTKLETLYLVGTKNMKDYKALSALKNLNRVTIQGAPDGVDVSGLAGSAINSLTIHGDELTTINGLNKLSKVTYLDLSDNQITKIPELKGMTCLETLDIENNPLTDISGLSGLGCLMDLYMDGDYDEDEEVTYKITDVSVLLGLNNLDYISLYNTQIDDLDNMILLAKKNLGLSIAGYYFNKYMSNEELFDEFAITELPTIFEGNSLNYRIRNWLIRGEFSTDKDGNEVELTFKPKDESIVSVEKVENQWDTYYMINMLKGGTTTIDVTCGKVTKSVKVTVAKMDKTPIEKVNKNLFFEAFSNNYCNDSLMINCDKTVWSLDNTRDTVTKVMELSGKEKSYIAKYVYEPWDKVYGEALVLDEDNTLWNWSETTDEKEKVADNVVDYDYVNYDELDGYERLILDKEGTLAQLSVKHDWDTEEEVIDKDVSYKIPETMKVEDITKMWIDFGTAYLYDKDEEVLYANDGRGWNSMAGITDLVESDQLTEFRYEEETEPEEDSDDNQVGDDQPAPPVAAPVIRYYDTVAYAFVDYAAGDDIAENKLYFAKIGKYNGEMRIFLDESMLTIDKDSTLAKEDFVEYVYVSSEEKSYLKTADGTWYVVEESEEGASLVKTDYLDVLDDGHILKKDSILYDGETPVLSQVTSIGQKSYANNYRIRYEEGETYYSGERYTEDGAYAIREDGSIWYHEGIYAPTKLAALTDLKEAALVAESGDVDGNGTVELKDAQTVLRLALLLVDNPTKDQQSAADVDGNGTVELKDAQQVLRKALLLIDKYEKAK